MRAFFLGDARESRPIETYAIELPLKGRFFRRREIHRALGFLNRVQRSDFPLAFGDLSEQLAVEIVEIQVPVSVALAGPEKALAVLEEIKVVADIDPIGILFAQGCSCFTRGSIGNQKIECVLCTIEALYRYLFRFVLPILALNINISLGPYIHGARLSPLH